MFDSGRVYDKADPEAKMLQGRFIALKRPTKEVCFRGGLIEVKGSSYVYRLYD